MSVNLFRGIAAAMAEGNSALLENRIRHALSLGLTAQEIHQAALFQSISDTGAKLRANELFLPHLLQAAGALSKAMDLLKPLLIKEGIWPAGRALVARTDRTYANSGMNLVTALLRAGCFDCSEMQTGGALPGITNAIGKNPPNILVLSADINPADAGHEALKKAAGAAGLCECLNLSMGKIGVAVAYCDKTGGRAATDILASCLDIRGKVVSIK